jgi:PTH1 family peptidyl-tRNA hydrolase
MVYLIAGLGNPGEEYLDTRHNVGFRIADELAARNKVSFVLERHAFYTQFKYKGRQVHLIKPTTYMNLSGKAVKFWMDQFKITPERLLVLVDELALEFGQVRIRKKGSDGGHNGLKDIQAVLGTAEYPRLRFGIGNKFAPGKQVNYVLGKWNAEESKRLPERLIYSAEACESFMFEGVDIAMNKYNKS